MATGKYVQSQESTRGLQSSQSNGRFDLSETGTFNKDKITKYGS